ncbi:MAG: GNAT family N-acetyltransferase [Defluviitaleaceae bacterium]|nr:GNAT family N-acetyltransferase [Defluviitaleaceae bacterium]
MKLVYRKIGTDDFLECANSLVETFKEEPWNENWTEKMAFERIDEIMSARVSRGYVVCDGEKVVAMLLGRVMTYLEAKELFVDEFSVNPKYQGHGIGSKLLAFVRDELKKENIHCMVLNTEKGYPAVKFYEKNDFKQKESIIFMVDIF